MLVLTRKLGEELVIADNIRIVVFQIRQGNVRLGIAAPRSVSVWRAEIYQQVMNSAHDGHRACASLELSINQLKAADLVPLTGSDKAQVAGEAFEQVGVLAGIRP